MVKKVKFKTATVKQSVNNMRDRQTNDDLKQFMIDAIENHHDIDLLKMGTSFMQASLSDSINWNVVPDGISPKSGCLSDERAVRKQLQIHCMLQLVNREISYVIERQQTCRIVEFGAGSGHLGLAIAQFFPNVSVTLVERKKYCVDVMKQRIESAKLDNCTVVEEDIRDFCSKQSSGWTTSCDIVVALHSCGFLTDLILDFCHKRRCTFVVCPCCYGQLNAETSWCNNSEYSIINPDLRNYLWVDSALFRGIDGLVDWSLLKSISSAADMYVPMSCLEKEAGLTQYNLLGKSCMRIIDLDRLLRFWNDESPYILQLTSLNPLECSPKNDVLVGRVVSVN